MFSGEPKKEEKRGRQETIKHVLTDKNTREIGIDSLSADVKMVSRENSDLKKELERVKKELEETKTTAGKSSDVGREMTRLRQDLDRLTQKNMELAKKVETGAAGGKTSSSSEDARADVNGASGGDGQFMEKKLDYKDPASFFGTHRFLTRRVGLLQLARETVVMQLNQHPNSELLAESARS